GLCMVLSLMLVMVWGMDALAASGSAGTDDTLQDPELYARSAVLMDGDTGRVLYGKNPDQVLPMASTTKVMTLIIALENASLDEIVTVSAYAAGMPDVQLG